MELREFEILLKRTIGLDAAAIGSTAIEHAVQARLSACNVRDPRAYWDRVSTSETELQELVEAVVIPETWFFRHPEAFAAMARMVQEEWLRTHPEGELRLFSLPCSTGEEPYSMAMALLDAGFPASRFRIDAYDISARALARARLAVYGKNSFRGDELGFRERYFESTAHGHLLAAAVRRQVHFDQGNLFDTAFLPGTEIYDVIFCRNVLIYFDRATQDRAIGVLTRLLTPKGLLFVGPSEAGLLLSHDFVSARVPLAFAFRKASAVHREQKLEVTRIARRAPSARQMASPVLPPPPLPGIKPAATQPPIPSEPKLGIEEARRLADQGRLTEAAQWCENYLRNNDPIPAAFYLLGLVRDATGERAEAAQCYRKALYLDSNHHEALVQLALLLDKQGDGAGAKALKDRARRLAQRREM